MNSQNMNDSFAIDIIKGLPYPVCYFSSNGDLLYSNQLGINLYRKTSRDFFTSEFKNIKNDDQTHSIKNIMLNDKEYLLTAFKIYKNKLHHGTLFSFENPHIYDSYVRHKAGMDQSTIQDLQTIFDNSYDVLYVSDGSGNTIRASSACEKLWGKKPEELIGRSVFELEKEGIFNPSATKMALEQGKKIQTIQNTKTGHRLIVTSTPIRDSDGNIIRVVNASRDITEIHELEEEIKEMKMMIEGYQKQLSNQILVKNQNKLIYYSKAMKDIVSTLATIASVDSTILITGESGVGKDVVSNYIHMHSNRVNNPFIKINCAAIPENLLESELFGYEAGAFTGANKNGKAGMFELANNGTLFLDEIGDMSLNLQTKLLRVLQDGEIRRVGGQKLINVDVRIIAATNQNLQNQINEKLFRKDLYYRLNVIPVNVPPLRERRDDIIPLIQHFLTKKSNTFNKIKTFSNDALDFMYQYDWPGNIRELENIVERLVVTSHSSEIKVSDIPDYMLNKFNTTTKTYVSSQYKDEIEVHKIMPLNEAVSLMESQLLKMAKREYSTLNEIAQVLDVNQSTISRKMQKYDLS